MTIKVIEKKKSKLKIELPEETHTLANLLREKAWEKGAKQASYGVEHPYLSKPEVIIFAANPKKVLSDSAQAIVDDAKAFEKEFSRAAKR